ncbi:hypothetical protein [Anaeromyxobacter oryzisoli]|uniref:hypothetical protein n=1 Tax=Anaeromyxobacter oryzisoli TaxID=2925408 RepID=UPI001F577B1B|nr:hypothetical protein [Anaeromyxobacter sp. SG63]
MSGLPPLSRALLLYGPVLLVAFVAGGLRVAARRPDLSPRRRRALDAAWIGLLLVGVPLWLVLGVMLRLW